MLLDLELSSNKMQLDTEVCVVGAGAAGVVLARDLMQAGHDVCLLEGGGLDFEEPTQALFEGRNLGMEYYQLEHARLRFFGGTTNIWGGRNVTLDRIDFEKRDWVPYSGWPIGYDELLPWYKIAHETLQLGAFEYAAEVWTRLGLTPLDFDPAEVTSRFWRFDTKVERFNHRSCGDLLAADNVRVVAHANVLALHASDSANGITSLTASSLSGKQLKVQAKYFVLACGAIENARLMLASNQVETSGIGNQFDQVGRYFMEHPHGRVAAIETEDPAAFWALYRKRYPAADVPVAPAIVLPAEQQSSQRILNSAVTFKLQKDPAAGPSLSKKAYLNLKHSLSPSRPGRRLWQSWRGAQGWLQQRVSMPLLRTAAKVNRMGLYVIARAE